MSKRTTLTLEDSVEQQLRQLAAVRQMSIKELANKALRTGLAAIERGDGAQPYRLEPKSLGHPVPGINLDKSSVLADAMEDECPCSDLALESGATVYSSDYDFRRFYEISHINPLESAR